MLPNYLPLTMYKRTSVALVLGLIIAARYSTGKGSNPNTGRNPPTGCRILHFSAPGNSLNSGQSV